MRRRKLGETFFLYYYCDYVLIEQDTVKGLSHLNEQFVDFRSICFLSITFRKQI